MTAKSHLFVPITSTSFLPGTQRYPNADSLQTEVQGSYTKSFFRQTTGLAGALQQNIGSLLYPSTPGRGNLH